MLMVVMGGSAGDGAELGQASCVGGAIRVHEGGCSGVGGERGGGRSVRVEMNPTRYGAGDLSSGWIKILFRGY
ncbi:hypothetical protein E2C01_050504 [Portunus trituberculatus]|uniref:Uncharacterized protein n=1 Tax=Portunus trituberculatus TaxID=210409 RepID=A0A5B7GCA0_PORTR|nr:hypothetical protein [Portunus trituberculatus]